MCSSSITIYLMDTAGYFRQVARSRDYVMINVMIYVLDCRVHRFLEYTRSEYTQTGMCTQNEYTFTFKFVIVIMCK